MTWLAGKLVRLRPIELDDVELLQRWVNSDSEARHYLVQRLPMSREQERAWVEEGQRDPNRRNYIIQTLDGHDIGTIGLQLERHVATFGIAIWEETAWGHGFGTDATRTIVDAAFATLPLVRIELFVRPDNVRAIRSYEKAGFSHEGVLRSYAYFNGEYCDVMVMSVTLDDWRRSKGLR